MPRAVVALIELDNGEVGTLCCAQVDWAGLEKKLKNKGEVHKIELEGWHTKGLPDEIKEGNLDGLAKERTEIIECPLSHDEYQLHVYKSDDYEEVYLKISEALKQSEN